MVLALNSYNLADDVAISQVYKGIMNTETQNLETRKIIKNPPANAEDTGDACSIPGLTNNTYFLLKNDKKYKPFDFSLLIY